MEVIRALCMFAGACAGLGKATCQFGGPWRDADRSCCARQIDIKYKALACILMAFEKKLYGTWLEPVEATITAHLKQPLLREDPVSKRCAPSSVLKALVMLSVAMYAVLTA